ncbi:MAG: universal stress protein [Rickettsiaceae bacterium]|nr:universal stress protein [Rickettsiaceae bacterium]
MFSKIIIPIDLTDRFPWKMVVPVAMNFVNSFGSELHFVYVIPDYGVSMVQDYLPKNWFKDQVEKSTEVIQGKFKQYLPSDVTPTFYIGNGTVYDEVLKYVEATKGELIILPAVRPELGDYMLGPNASKIARHAKVSVMLVRD